MKMKRNLIILGIAAVLVVGFVVALSLTGGGAPSASPSATPASTEDPALKLIDKSVSDTAEVTVQNAKAEYTVSWDGAKYTLKGKESLPLDQANAGSLFAGVAAIKGVRMIEQNVKDISVYGLDKPRATITATYKDGTKGVYLVGNTTPTGDTYYFMKQGDPRVVTIYTSYGDTFLGTADSLLVKQALTVTKDDIDTVKVLKDGAPVLEMTSKDIPKVSIAAWMIMKPWERAVDSAQLDTYLTAVTSVAMDSIVEANPADFAQYGLDKPAYDITISGKGKTDELLIGKAKDESYTYAKFANSPMVYQVSTSSLSFTGTSAYKLMDKMIILVNIQSATALEFNGLGQQGVLTIQQVPQKDDNGQIRKDSSGQTMYDQTFSIGGKAQQDDIARYFYQTCISLQTHSMMPEGTKPSSDTSVATLIYRRSSDPTEIKIEFLPYDKDFYAVRMNGSTDFLIAQEQVQTVADDLGKLKAGTLVKPQS